MTAPDSTSNNWSSRMKRASNIAASILALAFTTSGVWAQTSPSATGAATAVAVKSYRITYTLTEVDDGKRVGTQHLSIVVLSGGKSVVKEGSKVPVSTGTYNASSPTRNNEIQYQYLDIGLNVEAALVEKADGLQLSTKLEQSGVAEEKSPISPQDPIIRQSVLEDTSIVTPGKPLILGSLDIPSTTRRLDVEVVAEPVR